MQSRWRHYETAAGKRPVLEFIRKVSDSDKAAILAAMQEVRREGTRAARHLRGDLFEVRADGERVVRRAPRRMTDSHGSNSLFDISKKA